LDDEQQPREPDLAGLRIDLGANLGLLPVARARRLLHRVLHRGEHDRAVDRLLARDRIDDLQKFEPIGADGHFHLSFVLTSGPRLWPRGRYSILFAAALPAADFFVFSAFFAAFSRRSAARMRS